MWGAGSQGRLQWGGAPPAKPEVPAPSSPSHLCEAPVSLLATAWGEEEGPSTQHLLTSALGPDWSSKFSAVLCITDSPPQTSLPARGVCLSYCPLSTSRPLHSWPLNPPRQHMKLMSEHRVYARTEREEILPPRGLKVHWVTSVHSNFLLAAGPSCRSFLLLLTSIRSCLFIVSHLPFFSLPWLSASPFSLSLIDNCSLLA